VGGAAAAAAAHVQSSEDVDRGNMTEGRIGRQQGRAAAGQGRSRAGQGRSSSRGRAH